PDSSSRTWNNTRGIAERVHPERVGGMASWAMVVHRRSRRRSHPPVSFFPPISCSTGCSGAGCSCCRKWIMR
ncbi:hypothetical protein PFISCL1PPCAC_25987, partial [Pristionchus fissidentatus]